MQKYLVGISGSQFQEQEFKIVNASSENGAIAKFVRTFAAADDTFLEYVYDRAANLSFAEHFWLQTEDENTIFNETGQIMIDDAEFKKRVRVFFDRHPNYAEIYLDYYFSEENGSRTDLFPEE